MYMYMHACVHAYTIALYTTIVYQWDKVTSVHLTIISDFSNETLLVLQCDSIVISPKITILPTYDAQNSKFFID